MSGAPLTPSEDAEPTAPAIDYSPATVRYDETFENALMNAILYPSASGSSSRTPLSTTDLPNIPTTTLPIPLDSPLRTHSSPIPGVQLTHPNGYYTGGPGPSPSTVNEYAQRFISENRVEDPASLEAAVGERIGVLLEEVRETMREREKVVRRNEEVRRELGDLEVQRSIERRVQEKVKEEQEKRRRERGAEGEAMDES